MAFASHLSGYVKFREKYNTLVYAGECSSGPAAILRVWHVTMPYYEIGIKCTIALAADEAWCTDQDLGIEFIDLSEPDSCEQILAWMVLIGVASKDSKWHDPI